MSALDPIAVPQLDLGFERRGPRTVLARRVFSWPFVVTRTFALDAVPAHMLTLILQTGSGALHGEDRLIQRIRLGAGSAVHLTSQGATAVHRAPEGVVAQDRLAIAVEAGALLEYLPEPRILFPGAALSQSLDIDLAPDAVAIFGDAFGTHDPGGGEAGFHRFDSTTVLRIGGGEPVLVDRFALSAPRLPRGRHRAFGSLLLVAPRPREALEALSVRLSQALAGRDGLYAAASLLPGDAGLGLRVAATDLRAVRAALYEAWHGFRLFLFGQPPAPRRKE